MGNKSGKSKGAGGGSTKGLSSATGKAGKAGDGSVKIGRRFSHMQKGVEETKVCIDDFEMLKVLGS